MTKRESNKIDRIVEAAFKEHGRNTQFNIMDLSKIHNDVRNAVISGGDASEAMIVAVSKYRIN